MFTNRYCHRKAIEVFIKETIKNEKMAIDEKVYQIMNAKKIIKEEIKRNDVRDKYLSND